MNYKEIIKNEKKYAASILRIGLSLVFLYFGSQQIQNPIGWVHFLPGFAENLPITMETLIIINGISEIILGLLLIAGIFTRIVSFLLFVHILAITITMGYTTTGVRDFGITIGMLAVTLNGSDELCIGRKLSNKEWIR